MVVLSNILIVFSVIFMLFGVLGLFRSKTFYMRMLVSSKIDTVGMFTLIVGIALRQDFGFFTAKLLLLGVIIAILNPLVSHTIANCAYRSDTGKFINENEGE